jgi:RHS repeat-associated protein
MNHRKLNSSQTQTGDGDHSSFIGKEREKESSLGDFGVRKYDAELGRFMSIDLLFEKYPGLTPYNYCGNNPVSYLDKTGFVLGQTFLFFSTEN